MIEWHKHHLVPRHAGGDDSPGNLVKVNIPLHAVLHKIRFQETGDKFDEVAYLSLEGQIGHQEARLEASHESMRRKAKEDPEWREEVNQKISDALVGRPSPKPESSRENYRKANIEHSLHLNTRSSWGHLKGVTSPLKGLRGHKYNHEEVLILRREGHSWASIGERVCIPKSTVQRYYTEHNNKENHDTEI